jgi:hypothetical protein
MKRILYLGYYLKKLDKNLYAKFSSFIQEKKGISAFSIPFRIVYNSLKYNISILEYFQFRFFEKSDADKLEWAGTGHMYEYQLRMNPKGNRDILDDKTKFYKAYHPFFVHKAADLSELKANPELVKLLLNSSSGKLVLKTADGKCGKGVQIIETKNVSADTFLSEMEKDGFDLVEEFIIQHPDINKLSPSAVNTVRIFTQLTPDNQVEILGCRLRISVNSPIDNLAAGNLAVELDEQTGKATGAAIYSDITKEPKEIHPVTGVQISGFQVPMWNETIDMVKKAALFNTANRSIGWDIVITEKGPGLIEGNHDWCKLLWQLPVNHGLKKLLR